MSSVNLVLKQQNDDRQRDDWARNSANQIKRKAEGKRKSC
jgi:hypothetical protein